MIEWACGPHFGIAQSAFRIADEFSRSMPNRRSRVSGAAFSGLLRVRVGVRVSVGGWIGSTPLHVDPTRTVQYVNSLPP